MVTLTSIEEVIEKLGGTKAVAELTRPTRRKNSLSVVPNWVDRKKLPPKTYTLIQSALQARGFSAPNHLWGMP